MNIKQLANLKELFKKIPSVGNKTAQRYALYIINNFSNEEINLLIKNLEEIKNLKKCQNCNIISETDLCQNCIEKKDSLSLLIVSNIDELEQISETNIYDGLFYLLNGLIDFKKGIDPKNLNIDKLIDYIQNNDFKEIIICLSSTLEADITSQYIVSKIKLLSKPLIITKLASGIPFGSDLKYADKQTLSFALKNRKII